MSFGRAEVDPRGVYFSELPPPQGEEGGFLMIGGGGMKNGAKSFSFLLILFAQKAKKTKKNINAY